MKTLFVSGTDTEVGKTWISCQILRELCSEGHRVGAWKPVCSGAVEQNGQLIWEDVQSLTAAIGADATDLSVCNRVSVQRFSAPMAPNIAAHLEGRKVCDVNLTGGLSVWQDHADLVVVEGAGGLLSPASDQMLVADLVTLLGSPLLLVAANRLGTIHQTLATIEAAQSRRLQVMALVLNSVSDDLDPILQRSNERELRRLLPDIPLLTVANAGEFSQRSCRVRFTEWFQS